MQIWGKKPEEVIYGSGGNEDQEGGDDEFGYCACGGVLGVS